MLNNSSGKKSNYLFLTNFQSRILPETLSRRLRRGGGGAEAAFPIITSSCPAIFCCSWFLTISNVDESALISCFCLISASYFDYFASSLALCNSLCQKKTRFSSEWLVFWGEQFFLFFLPLKLKQLQAELAIPPPIKGADCSISRTDTRTTVAAKFAWISKETAVT